MQVVFISTLIISQIAKTLANSGKQQFKSSPTVIEVLISTGSIFDIAFVCLLTYSLTGVNKHMALFF